MNSFQDLYKNHTGKISHKWSIYLNQYEQKLKHYQNLPIKLLEVGVQNGGSLEIYSKYFQNAKLLLGCDIDLKCANLKFNSPNIKLIIGDVNEPDVKNKIIKDSKFDIIIDDGSHTSLSIVKAFSNYFNHLKDGGLFIIEDLHCSYWQRWGGGIFFPLSSINFFKKLIDIVNYEHWGIPKKKQWILRDFIFNYKIDIDNLELDKIHSIEFVNSLCFIKKKNSEENILGQSVISGKKAEVDPESLKVTDKYLKSPNENNNIWTNKNLFPDEQVEVQKREIEKLNHKILDLEKKLKSK